jgi:hypothetical protein
MKRYPLHMRLGGPHGWSGRVLKISSPSVLSLFSPSTLSVLLCPNFPGSAFRPYCTTHTTQTFMLPAGFEPAIPATELPQIRSLDRPARSELLYQLSYPRPQPGWVGRQIRFLLLDGCVGCEYGVTDNGSKVGGRIMSGFVYNAQVVVAGGRRKGGGG